MKNIAVIPVRAGSTRVKKKNYIDFFGKPMFIHTYDAAKESGVFDDIIVSTESEEVIQICKDRNIPVPIRRPDHLAVNEAGLDDVCLDAITQMEKKGNKYDNLCLLWATAPMRTAADIKKSYDMLCKDKEANAVIAVTDNLTYYPAHVNDEEGFIRPLVSMEGLTKQRAQELPTTYVDNGSIAWVRIPIFKKGHTWMPPKSKGYWMPRSHSVDVDTPDDLELLTYYYEKEQKKYATTS